MTEDDARAWVAARIDATAMTKMERFVDLVIDENARQNLIAPGTIATIWQRHIADSLQLESMAERGGRWLDIGSGGGFPGVVLAIAGVGSSLTMVEPRKRRVEFLQGCIDTLELAGVTVQEAKVENVDVQADVITARAVASVEKLLHAARHCCTSTTRWLLPRGSAPLGDLSYLSSRGMMFHVEQSLTEPTSAILILEGRPR